MEKKSYRFSKEERNFWILDVLIKYVAPTAVRKRFDVIIPQADLARILNSNISVIQNLISKKVINVHQQGILQGVPGFSIPAAITVPTSKKTATSSTDFDTTLMICLLRNLKLVQEPTTGWDRLPPDSDNSLGANLTRIKVYRNKLSHPSKSRINENSFNKIWSSLKVALSEISDGETDAIVHGIERFDLEGSNKEELLCRIQQEVHELKNELQFHRNLRENTMNLVEKWKTETEVFYKTRGTEEVLEKIKTKNNVMIVGNSGTGKTATMKYVSLLLEKEGYEIFPISSANDIFFQRFSGRKQLFIIDDIIGKYKVDNIALELWEKTNNRLELIFKGKDAKMICTLRRNLQKEIGELSISAVFNSTIVYLGSIDLALSLNERKGIFTKYMLEQNRQGDIGTEEIEMICRCNYAFPLLCELFFSNSEFFKRKAKFFDNPSIIFREELDRLQKKNNEVYCALVLNVIFVKKTLQQIFDITCDLPRKDDFFKILRACEVSETIPRKRLYRKLLSVSGSFVRSDDPFVFIHDRLEESITYHFASCYPEIMLSCCKREFILERVRIHKCHEDDDNVLIIERSLYRSFSKRTLAEIVDGKFRDVLLSDPLQNRDFVNYFITFLQESNISLNKLKQLPCSDTLPQKMQQIGKDSANITNTNRLALLEVLQRRKSTFIEWLVATGCYILFYHICQSPKNIFIQLYENISVVTDLLHLAVLGENLDIIKLLICKGGKIKSCDRYGIPLLCKIAKTNNCDIANLLLENGADIEQKDEVLGWTACFVATWFGKIEMLDLLLSKGSDANRFDLQQRTPLIIAVLRNNEQAVSVLLRYGASIYDQFLYFDLYLDRSFCFQEALLNKNSNIVQMLLGSDRGQNDLVIGFPRCSLSNKKGLINDTLNLFLNHIKAVTSGSSVWKDFVEICEAIHRNDIQMIQKVFNESGKSFYRTRLHGRHKIVSKTHLLANFNGNYLRLSLLHVAALFGSVNAAKILIKFGANPFQRDFRGRTPFHLTSSRNMIETLLSSKFDHFHEGKMSFLHQLIRLLLFLVSFKFIPSATRMLVSSRSGINCIDINGNTPLHSMVMRMTNVSECLDAMESLMQHGGDPRIRCERGFLPLDHFNTHSLSLDENELERGENMLGCPKTRNFIKREKCFLFTLVLLFISVMLWFYLRIVFNDCLEVESVEKKEQLAEELKAHL
ncbi:uncharacterized protein LOC134230148 [Saccostrea cucullata]|uniref:uncharacterized protein LOC134230148 n=1 Tax=Saccostrea cuccullata TaxID=36930 RepID=UPI002ED4B9F4